MKLVLGLGNPGKAYENTRHNAGFLVVDELARRGDATFRRGWFSGARQAKANVGGKLILLAKPETFMNRSGDAAAALLRRRGLRAEDLVVVVDDVELDIGLVRVRRRGGAGGHKGLESIIERIGTQEFVRVRVGVGPRPPGEELVSYVLGRFGAEERRRIGEATGRAADAVERVVLAGVEKAMNEFNQKQGEGGDT